MKGVAGWMKGVAGWLAGRDGTGRGQRDEEEGQGPPPPQSPPPRSIRGFVLPPGGIPEPGIASVGTPPPTPPQGVTHTIACDTPVAGLPLSPISLRPPPALHHGRGRALHPPHQTEGDGGDGGSAG